MARGPLYPQTKTPYRPPLRVAPKPRPRVRPRVSGPLSIYQMLGMETPQQLEARANRLTQSQLTAQRSIIASEYAQAQEEARRKMLLLAGAGRAAAAMNASLIGQVGGQYQAGADELSRLASAGAAAMSGATDASVAAANQATSNVGMPGVTVGGPVSQAGIAGPTQAGVESYYGGTLPAQALTNAGGYAKAGAAGQIAAQNLRAEQEASMAYLGTMADAARARQTSIKELLSQRPTVYQGFYDKLMGANKDMAQMYQMAQYRSAQIQQAQQKLDQQYIIAKAQVRTNAQKLQLDRWYKQQSAAIAAQRAAIYGQNAATSAWYKGQQAAQGWARIDQSGKGPGSFKGPSYQATISNALAKLPAGLRKTDAAFNWIWPRVKGSIPPKQRAAAQKFLRKQLKQLRKTQSNTYAGGQIPNLGGG